MNIEFKSYQTLPKHLQEIRDRAFKHSVLIRECKAMDERGEYCALYFDGNLIGAMNTLMAEKPIEFWSSTEIQLEPNYLFFCRGFLSEDIKRGYGGSILSLLSILKVLETNKKLPVYTTCRDRHKNVVKSLLNYGYERKRKFLSRHQEDEVELGLYKFTAPKNKLHEYKTKLISYLQQELS